MKTSIILIASLLVSTAMAQTPPPGRPGPPPIDMDRMALLLDMDSYQKTEVKKLLDAQRTEMQAQRKQFEASGERPSRDAMRAQREKADKALMESLQQVLNEQQIAKFKALNDRPRPMGPPPGERGNDSGRTGQ